MSNTEKALDQAEAQIEHKEKGLLRTSELLKVRGELVAPIDAAIDAMQSEESTEIPCYAASEDKNLDLVVKKRLTERSMRRYAIDLIVEGRLVTESDSARVPMYKISKAELYTDGGKLNDHYAVFVTDAEGDYQPIALIEQTILYKGPDNYKVQGSPRVDYDVFKAHDHLTALDMQELKDTGMWVDPRATDLLLEVEDILDLVANEEQVTA